MINLAGVHETITSPVEVKHGDADRTSSSNSSSAREGMLFLPANKAKKEREISLRTLDSFSFRAHSPSRAGQAALDAGTRVEQLDTKGGEMSGMTAHGSRCFIMMVAEDGSVGCADVEAEKAPERISLARRGILGNVREVSSKVQKIWVSAQYHSLPEHCKNKVRLTGSLRKLDVTPAENLSIFEKTLQRLKYSSTYNNSPVNIDIDFFISKPVQQGTLKESVSCSNVSLRSFDSASSFSTSSGEKLASAETSPKLSGELSPPQAVSGKQETFMLEQASTAIDSDDEEVATSPVNAEDGWEVVSRGSFSGTLSIKGDKARIEMARESGDLDMMRAFFGSSAQSEGLFAKPAL